MIFDALQTDRSPETCGGTILRLRKLLILAVATSIDALAVGVTFSFLHISIVPAVSLIGTITFILSFAGVCIGYKFGARLKDKAELAGGIVLI